MVQLVQIDVVRPESAQAVFKRLHQIHARTSSPVRPIVHLGPELRGQHHSVTLALQYRAHNLLALAVPVDIGGIEEIDAVVQRRIEDPGGLGLIQPQRKIHASKRQTRHFDAGVTEPDIAHCYQPPLLANASPPCATPGRECANFARSCTLYPT